MIGRVKDKLFGSVVKCDPEGATVNVRISNCTTLAQENGVEGVV